MLLTAKGINTKSIRRENVKVIADPVGRNLNINIDLSKPFKVVKIVAEACLMLTGLADFKKYQGL
jgi:hypothetical protein